MSLSFSCPLNFHPQSDISFKPNNSSEEKTYPIQSTGLLDNIDSGGHMGSRDWVILVAMIFPYPPRPSS